MRFAKINFKVNFKLINNKKQINYNLKYKVLKNQIQIHYSRLINYNYVKVRHNSKLLIINRNFKN